MRLSDESPKGCRGNCVSEFVSHPQIALTRCEARWASSKIKGAVCVLSQGWSGECLRAPACQRSSGMNGALETWPIKWAGTQTVRFCLFKSIISVESCKSEAATCRKALKHPFEYHCDIFQTRILQATNVQSKIHRFRKKCGKWRFITCSNVSKAPLKWI